MKKISNYKVINKIGEGAYGVVYHVKGENNNSYALKIIESLNKNKRFLRETEILKNLAHENIVGVKNISIEDKKCYIYMELCEQGDLRQCINKKSIDNLGSLHYFRDICNGLKYLHDKSIIHRDIKPENVLIKDGTGVITDFGIAKNISKEEKRKLTMTGEFVGTMRYMSPEQLKGEKVDGRSDIFSAGVLFYELLTKHHPFAKGNSLLTLKAILKDSPVPPHIYNSQISEDISAVCMKCLQKEKIRRYQSCDEILNDIKRIKSGYHIEPPEFSFYDFLRGYKTHFLLFGGVLLTALGGIIINNYYDQNYNKLIKKNKSLEVKIQESINLLDNEKRVYKERKIVLSSTLTSSSHLMQNEKKAVQDMLDELMKIKSIEKKHLEKVKLYYNIVERIQLNTQKNEDYKFLSSIKKKMLDKFIFAPFEYTYVLEKYIDFALFSETEEEYLKTLDTIVDKFSDERKYLNEMRVFKEILLLYTLPNNSNNLKYYQFVNKIERSKKSIKEVKNEKLRRMYSMFLKNREYELLKRFMNDDKKLKQYFENFEGDNKVNFTDWSMTKYYHSLLLFEKYKINNSVDVDLNENRLNELRKVYEIFLDIYSVNQYNEINSVNLLEVAGIIDVNAFNSVYTVNQFDDFFKKIKTSNNNIIYLDYINALYDTSNSKNSFGAIVNHSLQKYVGNFSRMKPYLFIQSPEILEESANHYFIGTNNFLDKAMEYEKKYEGKYSRYLTEKEIYRKIDKIDEILKISARVKMYSNRFTKKVEEKAEKIYLKALKIKEKLKGNE